MYLVKHGDAPSLFLAVYCADVESEIGRKEVVPSLVACMSKVPILRAVFDGGAGRCDAGAVNEED